MAQSFAIAEFSLACRLSNRVEDRLPRSRVLLHGHSGSTLCEDLDEDRGGCREISHPLPSRYE